MPRPVWPSPSAAGAEVVRTTCPQRSPGYGDALAELATVAARLLRAAAAVVASSDGRRAFAGTPMTSLRPGWASVLLSLALEPDGRVVEDATSDPDLRDHAVARGVLAWVQVPLRDERGKRLGVIVVADIAPRPWTEGDLELLTVLARAASAHLGVATLLGAEREAGRVLHHAGRSRSAERVAEQRLRRLTQAAMQLAGAETLEDLTQIVVNEGLSALGADGGAVAVREEPDHIRLAISDRLGEQVQVTYGLLPWGSPLPAAYTARTGDRVLLPTRASGLAFTPETAEVYADTGRSAWAVLPLRVETRLLGALVVSWVDEREFAKDELELLEGFAAQCALALHRIGHLQTQRQTALAVKRLSETLQRSLLTQPPTPDALQIAVRYQPAAQEAQVGGDWYDAFVTAAGATLLVIGDVIGHDRIAAAAMGQVRNVLRGLAYDSDDGPALLLTRLDRALRGLEVETMATAVVARVEQDAEQSASGRRRLRWSNAGHLPPLLRHADGSVEILGDSHDLLLGVERGRARHERAVDLVFGDTVLLYTDGLVERRGHDLDDGIAALARLFSQVGAQHPQDLCDAILSGLHSEGDEDDIALLVMRCS